MPVRWVSRLAVVLIAAAPAGCVEYDRSIVFKADGSGRASQRMALNLEALIAPIFEAGLKAHGDAASPAVVAAMKQQMLDSMRASFPKDANAVEVVPPPGATVTGKSAALEGNTVVITVAFSFSEPSVIPPLKFSLKDADAATSREIGMFEDLQVSTDGGHLTVKSTDSGGSLPPAAAGLPTEEVLNELRTLLGSDSTIQEMLASAIKDMRITTRVEAPWTVVETSAPRKDGHALTWEVKLDSIDKLPAAMPNILVRYRR